MNWWHDIHTKISKSNCGVKWFTQDTYTKYSRCNSIHRIKACTIADLHLNELLTSKLVVMVVAAMHVICQSDFWLTRACFWSYSHMFNKINDLMVWYSYLLRFQNPILVLNYLLEVLTQSDFWSYSYMFIEIIYRYLTMNCWKHFPHITN
jgi:ABC-type multidrug transport system fused ATPase/permease subunit